MILVGSQRGGASQLAAHLTNAMDNDHFEVIELRGFIAGDLRGALEEAQAIAKSTRSSQYLFSLSLNPPKDTDVRIENLQAAIDRAEETLGLTDQPRAVVIHEKNGRRHAHVVWSRIQAEELTAINLPFFKTKLSGLSKELYLEHGWELPDGHKTNGWKSPLNFTLAEWQQAKRLELDPREIKQIFRQAWVHSDNLPSLRHALEERGYFLAKGDRRAVVALDIHGEIYSLARWSGIKTKDMQQRLGNAEALPSVEQVQKFLRERMSAQLRAHVREDRENQRKEQRPLVDERAAMAAWQRFEREQLAKKQDERWRLEAKQRAERFRGGLLGVWELLTGKARAIRKENERDTYLSFVRDRDQRERLYQAQSKDRKRLQARIDALTARHREERMRLARRVIEVLRHTQEHAARTQTRAIRPRHLGHDYDLDM